MCAYQLCIDAEQVAHRGFTVQHLFSEYSCLLQPKITLLVVSVNLNATAVGWGDKLQKQVQIQVTVLWPLNRMFLK